MTDFFVFGYARDKENYRGKKSFEAKYSITNEPRNSFYIPLISLSDTENVISQRDIEITLLKKRVEVLERSASAEKGDFIKDDECVHQLKNVRRK